MQSSKKASFIERRQYWGLVFVLPAVIFFAIFFLFPIISGIYYSLTDFTLLKPPVFVGLQNYIDLFKDRLFLKSISVTLAYVVGSTIPAWILSLLQRGRRWAARMGTVIVAAGVVEMVIIVGQVL